MDKARILCVWRTGIASSVVMNDGVEKICKKHGVNYEILPCKAIEVEAKIETFKPVVIVSLTPLSAKNMVPVISGIPFLRGIGIDQVEQNIISALDTSFSLSFK